MTSHLRVVKDGTVRRWSKWGPGLNVGADGGSWTYQVSWRGLVLRDGDDEPVMVFEGVPQDFLATFCVKTYSGQGALLDGDLTTKESLSWTIGEGCI